MPVTKSCVGRDHLHTYRHSSRRPTGRPLDATHSTLFYFSTLLGVRDPAGARKLSAVWSEGGSPPFWAAAAALTPAGVRPSVRPSDSESTPNIAFRWRLDKTGSQQLAADAAARPLLRRRAV